jgi:hypothetical protein
MEISNETLLFDIRNTETEVHAYHMIGEGFQLLSELPENNYGKESLESQRYFMLEKECSKFLDELLKIKTERNI